MIGRWLHNLLLAIDQAANVLLAPLLNWLLRPKAARFGDPDETLSSVMGKLIRAGECRACRPVCWLLSKTIGPKQHCIDAIDEKEGGNAL